MNFKTYLKDLQLTNEDVKRDLTWLGCFVLNKKKHEVENTELLNGDIKKLNKGLAKLKKGVPLAHIIKTAPFYGLDFFVNKNVLIPRMETEILVEKVINDYKQQKQLEILDLCTGSGCIAITLKKSLDCNVLAVDVSKKALKIAQKNAKLHSTAINFIKSNMFDGINKKFDIIVSNPPYISHNEIEKLPLSVKNFDPRIALDGGNDGLDFYRIIANQAASFLKGNGTLYLEIGFDQGESVPKLLEENFKNVEVFKDFDNNNRIIKCLRR